MRHRLALIAALGVLVSLGAAIGLSLRAPPSAPASVSSVSTPPQGERPAYRPRAPQRESEEPLDPALLDEAARGELGVSLANRVCAQCEAGRIVDSACALCPDDGPRARVHLQVVDSEGRAWDPSDVQVTRSCRHSMGWTGRAADPVGTFDVPTEVDCRLEVTRYDGPFSYTVYGLIQAEAGEEDDLMIELPDHPLGGVGITIEEVDGVFLVEHLVPGQPADGVIPQGAQILSIDGVPPGEIPQLKTAKYIAQNIAGAVDSEVELRFGYASEQGWVEQVVRLPRVAYPASSLRPGWGPPG